jgi:hypothetical protein
LRGNIDLLILAEVLLQILLERRNGIDGFYTRAYSGRAGAVVVLGKERDGGEVLEGPQRGREAASGEDQWSPRYAQENDARC